MKIQFPEFIIYMTKLLQYYFINYTPDEYQ